MAPIEVLLPLYTEPGGDQIHFFQMLFTYPSIKDKFADFLSNWFRKREKLQPVFDLFFGALSIPTRTR